ncbi:MBL fold metallo-hydrolase [Simiduia curdlanivorans]|uniref:MBL fold metallo-hydrolase n=1 Tax=Simiduia curdlanivorans TaxID=1492769 RepID=A0ABV8V0E0_9GAMM|nr:MBL fold metallo-hydrolase [Simiduia curdlanivorans]MDN3637815.1 MBL fold metallo-hydrolase [Simiduia curdlanivorans]
MAFVCTACTPVSKPEYPDSDHFAAAHFFNPEQPESQVGGLWAALNIFWDFTFNKPKDAAPSTSPRVLSLTRDALLALPDNQFVRLGHSTLLFKLNQRFWLTDPVFAERVSPISWAGPKRFHASPIELNDLPEIEAVIISHDHYDHLDKAAIAALAPKTKHFIVPLGVGELLQAWGVAASQVVELDWHESREIEGVRLTATPAQHFSGRSLTDKNARLWASWVIKTPAVSLFFSGDTGYFEGFKRIGERYGPFDVTFVETGAYDPRWADIHMLPEQSVQAHLDLGGRWMMPIHNGTFDLAMHAWTEPFERVLQAATDQGVTVTTPMMGEAVAILTPHRGSPWWCELTPKLAAELR